MIDRINTVRELIDHFYRLSYRFTELEKMPYDFGIGEMLYPSEIHTIQAIGKNSGINITKLANNLGITKGSVSQMVTKLKKRGFISKVKSVDNDKEVLLMLTKRGQQAYDGHENFHNEMYVDFIKYAEKINPEQIAMLKEVLKKIEFHMEQYRVK